MSEISKYITIIRPEFMAFCKDACRSAALNHLLFRISGKCKDQPREKIQSGEILWYAKTELIASEMSDAWGVCKVRKEVNELVSMGLFGRKSNPTWGVDRTKHFCFGSEQCEAFIKYCENNEVCIVHLDLPAEVKHLIYSSLANDRTIKCTCEKADLAEANDKSITCIRYIHPMHSIDLSPAFDKSIEAITKTSTKTSNKDNSKEEDTGDSAGEQNSTAQNVANATTPARHSQDEPYRPDFSAAQPNKPASQSEQDRVAPRQPASVEKQPEEPTQATLTMAPPAVSAKLGPVDIKTLSLQTHADYVFRWLDEIKKEAKRDERANYVKNKNSEKLIKDLITSCWNTDKELTRENVRKAWRQMWNSKPGKDGFTWKKAGISIEAYFRHYGEYLEKAWDEESREQEPAPAPVPTASTPTISGLPRWRAPGTSQAAVAQ